MSNAVRKMIDNLKPTMLSVLPKHMNIDRFALTAVIALNKNPALGQCSQESWKLALMTAAELGLDCSGTTGMSYLVPYGQTVTLIPGYRGLMDLARRTGEVKHMQAFTVYERDHFEVHQGSGEQRIIHVPFIGEDRGPVIVFYSVAWHTNGIVSNDWMTKGEVDKIRAKSKAKDAMAWTQNYNEMGKKTVVRRHCKYLPTSAELERALALDVEAEEVIRDITPSAPRASSQAKVAERLGVVTQPEIPDDVDPDTGEIVPPSETLPGVDTDDAPEWNEH